MKFFFFKILFPLLLLQQIYLEALPSFARNLGLDCTTCHTAYPQLTEFGKMFLEMGGDLLIQKEFGVLTMTTDNFSGHVSLLPIDKRFSSDSTTRLTREERQLKLRAYHEVDAYMAGRVGKFFFFTVLEADDDWNNPDRDGFDLRFTEGFVMFRMLENFSIFSGYDSPYIPDGNDTVKHPNVLERQWKAADYTPGNSQMLGLTGMLGNFYWIASWHADAGVTLGNDPKSFSFRAAYDYHQQTFGAYFSHGFHYNEETEQSEDPFYLYGLDAHLRFRGANILMLLGFRNQHRKKLDYDFSIEVNKVYHLKNKLLTEVIPIGNLDFFVDRDLSSGLWIQGSAGIAFYANPAVRILPQIAGTLLSPSPYDHQELRFMISADVGL